MSALTPTRPTFLRSPAPAMPCTTTQNTMGATIMEMSLRNASLRTFKLTAKPGTHTPNTMPKISPSSTCTNSDLNIPPSPVLGGAAGDRAAVDIEVPQVAVPRGLYRHPKQRACQRQLVCAH